MNPKKLADAITGARALLALLLVWIGWTRGADALTWATWILLVNWTGDAIDGPIARRSPTRYHTWIGDHDLHIDMAFSAGLLAYMAVAGFVDPRLAGLYAILWALLLAYTNMSRALGMFCQAPVYGWFIWTALRDTPAQGRMLIIWILVAIAVTWPRFPQQIVPGFLEGVAKLRK